MHPCVYVWVGMCVCPTLAGSTEVAADVTCHVIPRTSPHTTTPTTQSLPPFLAPSPQPPSPHWVPAGAPIRNTAILILPWTPEETTTVAETDKTSAIVSDKSAAGLRGGGVGVRVVRPCARGVVGQVCVVGAGLARGYLGSPAATAARSPRVRVATQGDLQHVLFGDVCSEGPDSLKTALMSDEGVVAFLTGDLGQINQDGGCSVLHVVIWYRPCTAGRHEHLLHPSCAHKHVCLCVCSGGVHVCVGSSMCGVFNLYVRRVQRLHVCQGL